MACCVPVIGARVGGIKYSVVDGKTGFLVPPNDPATLSQKINVLLTNNRLMERMRANALRRVNKYFTWSCVANSMNNLYEAVFEEPETTLAAKRRVWFKDNFTIKLIRGLFPESFYGVLNMQYEKGCVPG
jgi:hypothetical protein